ncbi:MAG TPA: hypothetical protein VFM00_07425 [Candidatus Eisenbacteria bacterium]|nr:hypothetical protein [Candidatus Eisenbacteria bacterium]
MIRLLVVGLALLGLGLLAARPGVALPRYSARYQQTCALCHVNPTGGGLRTSYATEKIIPEEIAWRRGGLPALEDVAPSIARHVQVGTDFREVYVGADLPQDHLNFFQMQADLYFSFQLDSTVALYYDRGESGSYELFGLDYLRPELYVKAGRFVPSYGWKFDDHTMFVRAELGFMPPANSDVGLEAGYARGPLDLQAAVVNGNRGLVMDSDTKVAGVVNAVFRHRLGPVGASLGGAAYHQPGFARDYDTWGLYGYLTWNRLTWLAEGDFFQNRPAGGPATIGAVTSHEVTVLVRQGLELKGTYDFFDPDRDKASGAKSRYGGGVAVMPRPYAACEALVRRTAYEEGVAYSGRDLIETVIMLHLLY